MTWKRVEEVELLLARPFDDYVIMYDLHMW